jgi:hypothetical protein
MSFMKKINILIFALVTTFAFSSKAQTGPYLEAIYDVQVTQDVVYGVNATILPIIFQQTNEAIPRPLIMDVYEPVGDDGAGPRPVMLVMHTGNFLPFPENNGTGGTIRDSTVVEACTRLAQRGYVAAAVDYRKGWNPVDPIQDIRKFFLINAAYRGIQDVRTAVRFMRLGAVDGGNPYNIDPDKIGVFGIGTGGYIVAGIATLDVYDEIIIPKFLIDLDGPGPAPIVPMVLELVNGDINGTSVGIVPPGYPVLPAGDTLCYPNHVTYADGSPISSDVGIAVNLGGALGDTSWIDENTVPWVSFHAPEDIFAPYTTGTLTVPGTGDPADPTDDFAVVEVSGSFDIQAKLAEENVNAIFDDLAIDWDDYSSIASERSGGLNGLFPLPDTSATPSGLWDFYAEDNPNIALHPMPNPELARTYWDTIFTYMAPRACVALDLPCMLVDVNEVDALEVGLSMAPNPARDEVSITTGAEFPIQHLQVFDAMGRLVRNYTNVNSDQITIQRADLSSGMYYLRFKFEEGITTQKLMFK